MYSRILFILFVILLSSGNGTAQQGRSFCVTGYYAGAAGRLDSFQVQHLTHLIYSFGHLKGNRFNMGHANDTATLRKMAGYKKRNPFLKIILSLGGWGGCRECPAVFSTDSGRKEFARSVKETLLFFRADGIDLDWEYPAIAGYPGHPYGPADKDHFTSLLKELRRVLGKKYEISFAAGGFDSFIDSSVNWTKAMRYADKVYVMSYDLVHGASTVSGHHTPLYSTPRQKQSTDNAVNRLLEKGVAPGKIVIGAAFYARMFNVSDTANRGLYNPCRFYRGISYSHLYDSISPARGFNRYWDETARAPYAFHPGRKILVTYDDSLSVSLKTKYAMDRKLGGIMFWQLADDAFRGGLLEQISRFLGAKASDW